MEFIELASKIAVRANAVVSKRHFLEKANRGRTCCVDLRNIPMESIVVCVDKLVRFDSMVESAVETTCWCGNRRGAGRHRQCDYAIFTEFEGPLCVLVEVKSGTSNQAKDVTDGFEQLLCSKSALVSMLVECGIGITRVSIVGVVVSPATYWPDNNDILQRKWSRQFKMRLTQTPCGTDVWRAAVGHEG